MRSLRVLGLLTTIAIVGCSGSTAPDSGLTLTAAVDRTAFVSGDSVHITVSVTNNRATDLTISKVSCAGASPGFRVTNVAGDDVVRAPTSVAGTCEFHLIAKVPPGDTYSTTFYWDGGSIDQGLFRGSAVAGGPYDVRGVFVNAGEVIAESPPVRVEVLAQ